MKNKISDAALGVLATALYDEYRLGKFSKDPNDFTPMWHQLDIKGKASWMARAFLIYGMMVDMEKFIKIPVKKLEINKKRKTIYRKKAKQSKKR